MDLIKEKLLSFSTSLDSMFSLSLIFLLAVSVASGHTIFQQLYVNGADQGHLTGIRVPDYDGPIMDVTSNDIICNGGINPYHTPMSSAVITVPAGATVVTEWHHTLDGANPTDTEDPIATSHHGPIMTYLAQVPNATQTTVTGLKWFKIWQDGLQASDQSWGVDRMVTNKGKVTFTIPACIPAGQYLMRHEIIGTNAAGSYPGAQFYMECAQLTITGGGSTIPATVSFPGAYSGTDPGITINIYQTLSNYTVPGPSVFSCSGSSGTSTTSTKATTTVSSTTKATTTVSSTTSPSSTGAAGTVAQYGQCGGLSYTGPTTCISPFKCNVVNAYVSFPQRRGLNG
ncbi:glycosyl hydrolase family 61-domain-containing protein [Mycena floridula]|nr:glycosyl hydrolase family 61-domain-containing protein [Mycena floridula]